MARKLAVVSEPKAGAGDSKAGTEETPNPVLADGAPGFDTLFPHLEGPDVRVRVDRSDDITRKWTFHGYLDQSKATEAQITELFGGGDFRAQLTQRAPPSGYFAIKNTRFFHLPGPYKPVVGTLPGLSTPSRPVPETTGSGAATASSGGSLNSNPNEIVSSALVHQLLDLMQNTKNPVAAAPFDWTPIILGVIGLVERYFTSQRAVTSPELTRLVADVQALRTEMTLRVQTPTGPASSAIKDAAEAIRSLMGVRDIIRGGEGGDEDHKDDAALSLGNRVLDMLQGQKMLAGGGNPTPPSVTVGTEAKPMIAPWQMLVRGFGNQLVNAAAESFSPEDTADHLYGLLPSRFLGPLEELLANPNVVGLVLTEVPRLQPHGPWVQALVEALRAIVATGPEDDDAPPSDTQ